MLSSTALIWTMIAAAFCWFCALNQIYALWKTFRAGGPARYWSVVQGRITISKLGVTPTHPSGRDPAHAGAVLRYRYRVGDKDYEGDGFHIGRKSRAMGLLAKAMIKKFPEGRPVDVYFDPADPTKSALEPKGKGGSRTPASIVFLVVFGAIAGILTAHAIAGKVLTMGNGLPVFALGLPAAALLVAVGCVVTYITACWESRAVALWPTTQGRVTGSRVVEETERRTDDDGDERESTTYRADIRFTYRVGDADYSSDNWKPGMLVSTGSPKPAEAVVARYPVGRTVAVYYDPTHPDCAVLEPANRQGAAVPLVVAIAFGLAGALFMWAMTHGKWVNAATGS
jgi:hypothetical protein